MKLPGTRIGFKSNRGQIIGLGRLQVFPSRFCAQREAKTARVFEGALRSGKALRRSQERKNAALSSATENEMTGGGALMPTGDHAAGVEGCDAESIRRLIQRPSQELRAGCRDTENAAHSARPPAASEKTRGVDGQPDADCGFIADDGSFEKMATAAAIFFRHGEQRRDDHSTDAGSRSAMNIIHLAAVCSYSHSLDGIQKRNPRWGSQQS